MGYTNRKDGTGMGEKILLVLVLLLALYGCTQLIRWLALRLLEPEERDRGLRILPVSGHRDDLEFVVRAAAVQRRWAHPLHKPERLLLLDAGMDGETRRVAELLSKDVPGIELWDTEKLEDFLDNGLQETRVLLE